MSAVRLAALAAVLSSALSAQVPCRETNLGVSLGLTDDSYSSAQALGFAFNFGGVAYTDCVVCSNGYIWLGVAAPVGIVPDYTPTEAKLSTEGPRIAPLWVDFNPSAAGSGNVMFNAFPAVGSTPARAVITWDNVFLFNGTTPLTMQVQLTATGDVIMHYDSNMGVVAGGFGSNAHVMGCSNGSGAINPVSFATLPIVAPTNPTAYQTIARGAFPYVGQDFDWLPSGNGTIVTARPNCASGTFTRYGTGCPRGLSAYELYPTAGSFDLSNQSIQFISNGNGGYIVVPGPGFDTSYTAAIAMQDDTLLTSQPLGFTFPFAGGLHTAVDLSSNGMVYMAGGTHGAVNGYPDAPQLLTDPNPIIAFLWQDLDLSTAGQAFWDVSASSAMFTIVGAPYWNQGGSNDAQLKILSSGDIIMSWRNAASTVGGPCMVGLSEGGGASDPGAIDWSTALPTNLGAAGTLPLSLDALSGSRPGIGLTFTMQLSNIPAGTALGAMILSFTRQNLDVGFLGMPGCHQYVGLDASFVLLVGGSTANFNLNIPNSTAYLGQLLRAQAATFSAGFNAFGVIASNGGEMRIGL